MSRTSQPQRGKAVDFYPTPAWCVDRLLEELVEDLDIFDRLPGPSWLEPAVGDGAIVRAVNRWCFERGCTDEPSWTTVDIRPEVEPDIVADFPWFNGVCLDGRCTFDVAITNPPFSQAEDFVHAALDHADVVIMLLRLGWLASASRAPLLREHPPSVYVLPDRPSFDGEGTDSADYAWMVWGLGAPTVRVLATTPIEKRR